MCDSLPLISVCIAAYKRPHLHQLLDSLLIQKTDGLFRYEIVVVDNDYARSGESIVRRFIELGHDITYAVEPEKNIALARNKSLSLARGDYIATIDDDERADRCWLLYLLETLRLHDADVVHAPSVPLFPKRTPAYIRYSDVFSCPNPATGSTSGYHYSTSNSFFRKELVSDIAQPFDPAYGLTGGEDTAFYMWLERQGCRMVWCREALTYERIPPSRANLRWTLQRKFRSGLTRSRIEQQCLYGMSEMKHYYFVWTVVREIVKLFLSVALNAVKGVRYSANKLRAVDRMQLAAYKLGTLAYFFGIEYHEYK